MNGVEREKEYQSGLFLSYLSGFSRRFKKLRTSTSPSRSRYSVLIKQTFLCRWTPVCCFFVFYYAQLKKAHEELNKRINEHDEYGTSKGEVTLPVSPGLAGSVSVQHLCLGWVELTLRLA